MLCWLSIAISAREQLDSNETCGYSSVVTLRPR
jgi:hypothetical protein